MKALRFLPLILFAVSCSTQPQNKPELTPKDFFSHISQEKLKRHVSIIADDSTEGRGFGTAGLKKAAKYVAKTYERIGLKSVNSAGSNPYYQPVKEVVDGKEIESQNVIGIIEGSDDQLKEEAIVVIAHLDHLGIDPELEGDNIYNGAADDASGVGACLLLAEAISQAKKEGAIFKRSIIFLNTTGEEKHGRAGSRYYAQYDPVVPLDKTIAVINLDGVAGTDTTNLGENNNYVYMIIEDSTSIDLRIANERINKESGINLELLEPPFSFGSDQKVFEGWLIPSIYYSTGFTSNYHQVSDHASSIDYAHAQKIVQLAYAMIWELANTPNPTPSFKRADYRLVTDQFRCRPCGCKLDHEIFDQSGTCPDCHMALIPVWKQVSQRVD